MKGFIGLVTYFSPHIVYFGLIVKYLHASIPNYSKKVRKHKLVWTPKLQQAYEAMLQAVEDCSKLYFVNNEYPLYCETDASKYGIGSVIYQTIEGVFRPIAIMSKSLTGAQLRWSVPEKEAYAIYYTLKRYAYILRDTPFHLKTDHRNLTYINDAGSDKVLRWKLAIQEYPFQLSYIPGKDNVIADALSRYCALPDESTLLGDTIIASTIHHSDTDTLSEDFEYCCSITDSFTIPTDVYEAISKVHNMTTGHHGVERTLSRLLYSGNDYGESTREYVRWFIKHCPCCQKMSYLKVPIITNKFVTSRYNVMERVAIDTIGPLPEDENGNKHIIVLIDSFTRYTVLYPAKDTTAPSAAKALLHFVGRFGCPAEILTDNGTQYANSVIKHLSKLLGTSHVLTMAYSKEENGLVERANKEVGRHLRSIIFETNSNTDWSDRLPIIERILNTEIHSSTGVAPYKLIYGNSIDLDRSIFTNTSTSTTRTPENLGEWASRMLSAQKELIDKARSILKKKDEEHLRRDTVSRTEFAVDSYVLVQYENTDHRPPSKLHTHWRGPLQVVSNEGPIYTLRNLVNNKLEDFHVKNIKQFLYDPAQVDPRLVANKDYNVYDIESILKHKGKPTKRSSLQFLVKWVGYDNSHNTWEPWSNVRDNIILHQYLRDNKQLKSLVPDKYKQ